MRVISGTARGTKLFSNEGLHTRPTADRVKEALFNILAARIAGSTVLDVFGGTGGLAVEALSRGATYAVLIDNDAKSIEMINKNLIKTKLINSAKILKADFEEALKKLRGERFDIIFIDPPYSCDFEIKTLQLIKECDILDKDGVIVLEKTKKKILTCFPFEVFREEIYGNTSLVFLKSEDSAK